MSQRYHNNARTTQSIRKEFQESNMSIVELAKKYSVSTNTVSKWKHRDFVCDKSSRPRHPSTKFTELQSKIIVEVRKFTLLPLDDLYMVIKKFIPHATRSSVLRCLKRHKVKTLKEMAKERGKSTYKTFKYYKPGYIHIDIKVLPKINQEKKYLFVAIDRATRLVCFSIKDTKTCDAAVAFLQQVETFYPFTIYTVLTDNGKEFTDRYVRNRIKPSGKHMFDKMCSSLEIDHRLTKAYTPKTNGMVERMNGRVENLLETTIFLDYREMEETFADYLRCYNMHITQRALEYKTPWDKVCEWYEKEPPLFKHKPTNNLPNPDIVCNSSRINNMEKDYRNCFGNDRCRFYYFCWKLLERAKSWTSFCGDVS